MSRLRIIGIVALVLAAIIVGSILAWRANLMPQTTTTAPTREAAITFNAIRLGVPVGTDFRTLNQKTRYYNDEQLALRVDATAMQPYNLGIRLVDENNTIVPFTPGQLTLNPGVDGFCCWQIPNGGEYRLQLLRPDGATTTIDLAIRERRAGQSDSGL